MSHRSTNFYRALITAYHRTRARFTATVVASVKPFVDNQNAIEKIPEAFDLDVSAGVQEDIDGEWIGRTRHVNVPQLVPYFSLGIAGRGLNEAELYDEDTDPLLTYTTVSLSDARYRALLRAKVAANEWDGTSAGAQVALNAAFAGYYDGDIFVEDPSNHSMAIAAAGVVPTGTELAIFNGLIPLKPAGIETNILVTSAAAPIFGLGVSNGFVAGLGEGAIGVSPEFLVLNG